MERPSPQLSRSQEQLWEVGPCMASSRKKLGVIWDREGKVKPEIPETTQGRTLPAQGCYVREHPTDSMQRCPDWWPKSEIMTAAHKPGSLHRCSFPCPASSGMVIICIVVAPRDPKHRPGPHCARRCTNKDHKDKPCPSGPGNLI